MRISDWSSDVCSSDRQSNEGVTNWLKTMKNLTVYEGHGRLESSNSVRVNGDLLEAGQIVLNVGGRAIVPAIPGVDEVDYLPTSRSEGRRVGKACVSTCRSRWSPSNKKKKPNIK